MKMSKGKGKGESGVGFLGLLGLLFIGLKLGKVIDWEWKWVTAPLWVPAAFVVVILLAWAAYTLIAVVNPMRKRRP
jgi:hypothetical protein